MGQLAGQGAHIEDEDSGVDEHGEPDVCPLGLPARYPPTQVARP